MLDVCLPGTGGMMPLPGRWLTCCWMEHQGRALLIDCGEGTQVALRQAGLHLARLEVLLITHFHADHIAGLPGLLLTLGNFGKRTPLLLAGPPGLCQVAASLLVIAPALPYEVQVAELSAGAVLPVFAGVEAASLPLSHWVPCYGYRVTLRRKPVFAPQRAENLGVPKPLYRALHAGQAVTLPDGRRISPAQVLGAARPPIAVCYATDTRPIGALAAFARDADLFIAEGMYGEEGEDGRRGDKGHSLFAESARLATRAGARRLWLTHFSPALTQPQDYIGRARAHFPAAVAASDGMRITLKGEPPAAGPKTGKEG